MKIGFDAKRAYHNKTGLGNYSRTLIQSLAEYFPENEYYLFNPKPSEYTFENKHLHEIKPVGKWAKAFSPVWRTQGITSELKKLDIDLYHGLSHEIPLHMERSGTRSVVTIHDLIFERYPRQYNPVDVLIYRKKFLHACRKSDKIIAISQQTKEDIISYYKVPEDKIVVCYQACDKAFSRVVNDGDKARLRLKYKLPASFYLYVGSIIERKNLLSICKAMMREGNLIPLVVIGNGGTYKKKVKDFVIANGLQNVVLFMSDLEVQPSFAELPIFYQSAVALLYVSVFEGFGIPVLESLYSHLPVITSGISSLPEAGGDAAIYVNPYSTEEIAIAMRKVLDERTRREMIEKGIEYSKRFTLEKCATSVMNVYKEIC